MREIKFRGKVDGVWWYASPDSNRWEQFWALVDRETVGQYVGRQDANGTDVYEDDIVAAISTAAISNGEYTQGKVREKVQFKDGLLLPFYQRVFYGEEWWTDRLVDGYRVIGNAHDHPERLKPEEEQ